MKQRTSLSISVRRHFIDEFFFFQKHLFHQGTKIIDVGGKRTEKRGLFNIETYGTRFIYVNIDESSHPDIIASAENIPVPNSSYDIVIMGELLEHVPDPRTVVIEAHRILKSGGVLLATVPFMIGIHSDPSDYGRYTDSFWKEVAKESGFSKIVVEAQGTLFAVAALMLQHLFLAKKMSWRPIQIPLVLFLMWLDKKTTAPLLKAWTTGYGLVFTK